MITLKMITNIEDLLRETGLATRNDLWDAGFIMDDWDVFFESDTRLVEGCEEFDEDGYLLYEPEAIPEAYWLVSKMETHCVGYHEVEHNGKWYYSVHHA